MHKLKKNFRELIWFGLILGLIAVACNPDTDEPGDLPRMFTPGTITATPGETQVRLTWGESLHTNGEVIYELEVSKDTTFASASETEVALEVNTNEIVITDEQIEVRTRYFARVRAKGKDGVEPSNWMVSNGFMITGEQIFHVVSETDIKDTSVKLRWREGTQSLTKIILQPVNADGEPVGDAIEFAVSEEDMEEAEKILDGLEPVTRYRAEIYRGNILVGFTTFTTKEPSIYTLELHPGDDIYSAINNAENGAFIGLHPGEYDILNSEGTFTGVNIIEKSIIIESVSGNPNDTKVNYREFVLRGDGASLTLRGIEFDGQPSNDAGVESLYFLDLKGTNANGSPANFGSIIVENCIVRNMGNCFLRGNRTDQDGAQTIDLIKIHNTQVYNSATKNTNYGLIIINKLAFGRLEITNSTFHKIGRSFVDWSTTMTVTPTPEVFIDQVTVNGWGMANGSKRVIFDANSAPVNMTIQNSIFANTPYPGDACSSEAIRARGEGSILIFKNNNYFNLTDGGTDPQPLVWRPELEMSNNKEVNLGWNFDTNTFNLPSGSELRTSGTSGGPVGDPRWAN